MKGSMGEQGRFNVISPDGLPIGSEPFNSRKEAEAGLAEWCKRFETQGYYAAVSVLIPLADLPSWCLIEKIEGE